MVPSLGGAGLVTLPLAQAVYAGLLVLSVWFDGVPLDCLVDTGAQMTVLTAPAAARVAHALSDPVPGLEVMDASGHRLPATAYAARHIGTRHLGWPAGEVLVVPALGTAHHCVLGVNLLGRQPIVLDWVRREVRPVPEGGVRSP